MSYFRPFFFIAFLSIPCLAQTQNTIPLSQRISMGLGQYRAELLHRDTASLQQFKTFLTKLDGLNWDDYKKGDFLFHLSYELRFGSFKKYHHPKKKIKLEQRLQEKGFSVDLSIEEMNVVYQNAALIDLIGLELLELYPPFKIVRDSPVFKELAFYNISDGDQIGEVGAGSGAFSLVLGTLYSNIWLQINEYDYDMYKFIIQRIKTNQSLNPNNNFRVVVGGTKKTFFKPINLDKIIIRNTLHHFQKKEEMLADIKASLNPNGYLLINEYLLDASETGKDNCKKKMTKTEILRVLADNGFVLIDQYESKGTLLLKLKIR